LVPEKLPLPTPTLTVSLLGAPLIEVDGELAEFDTRKAIALLAYLAVNKDSHTRDALATMFWPELDQSRARAALRRTLSSLKNAIGETYLEIDREFIGLNPAAGFFLDLDHFEKALQETQAHGHTQEEVCPRCLTPLSSAVDLYRGDFLSGFTLRDSPNFDDWQFFQADELRRKYALILEKLVQGYAAQGEFERAIEYARHWLNLDPLHEIAHRELMRLFALAGHRSAALRQYRECVRILSQELDVSPLEETVQLYEDIRDGSFPPETFSTGDERVVEAVEVPEFLQAEPSGKSYTLVGRAPEWNALIQTYDAVGPQGHFVVLAGEAGIGKTRLSEEFLAHAWTRGAVTIKAKCYEGETDLSYGPFIEGLRTALNQTTRSDWADHLSPQWLSEIARLLPDLAGQLPPLPDLPSLEGPGAQSRFYEAIARFILALCEGPVPGVLFIDDLHWADAASLDLLAYLVRRLRRHSLLILAVWRSEEIGRGHRLDRLLTEAQRAGTGSLITLSRWDPSDINRLLDSLPDLDLPDEFGHRLYRETEGLPFFVIEYLAAILKTGQNESEIEWELPGSVRDLLNSRLSSISETGLQILTTAAVIGRSFDFDILRIVSGRGEEEVITALEELIRQRLVQEVSETGNSGELHYDFNHEKLRGLVYEQTSLARRRLLHHRVAEHLVYRARFLHNTGQLAGQIARHFQWAGDDEHAVEYFKLAGEQAKGLYANQDALNHFQTALALGHPDAALLHEAIGDLQTLLGDYDAALSSYETAAAVGKSHSLASTEHKLGSLHHRLGEWGSAESHFQSALAALDKQNDTNLRALIYSDWSLTAHSLGEPARARDLARKALRLAQTVGDQRTLAQIYNLLGILARGRGDLNQAKEHLQNSLELADSLDDPEVRVAALNNLALVHIQDDDLDAALTFLKTALSLCASIGDRHREAALHSNLADLYHFNGLAEESIRQLKQSAAIYADIGEQAGIWQPEIWKLVEW
jgi:DNA-binding SARP family transcriptional activator/predicted negative regulator of RcsB-dependent stress response